MASHRGEQDNIVPCRSSSSTVNAWPGVLYGETASVETSIGEAETGGVPTCISKARATGNPLPKPGAQLAAVATWHIVGARTVPGPVLSWGIGIVTLRTTGMAASGSPSWWCLAEVEGLLSVVAGLVSSSRSGCWLGPLVDQNHHNPDPPCSCPCQGMWLPTPALWHCGDCIPLWILLSS